MLRLLVDKTQSLKEFTENHYAQASFYWRALLKDKEIKVNGKRIDKDRTVYAGDVVEYYLTAKQDSKPAFSVAYEDENILVADKENGVNSEAVYAALARSGEYYFIHRLDRNTQGLLLFAKNAEVAEILLKAFKERRVEKRYHALCFGSFVEDKALLTAYLKKSAEKSLVQVYDNPTKGAEQILTEYRVIERRGDGTTKVEVFLHTGKTHQIRAHLAHIGCPVVGDMKYGDEGRNKAVQATRQCLIAKHLSLELDGTLSYLNGKLFASHFEID